LGKDFERLYLPKVPLTFDSWVKLKDWFSVALAALSLLGFGLLRLGIHFHSLGDVSVFLLFLGGGLWAVSGLVLFVRRPIAGLVLLALTTLTFLLFRPF